MKRPIWSVISATSLLFVAACSGGGLPPAPSSHASLSTPAGVSPGSLRPAPMASTQPQPAGVMAREPASTISSPSYTQLPGTASQVAAAADGSIWVLSDQPAGSDKFIWHYTDGTWTNIGGLASQIAVAPDGSLDAVNSGGGVYHYSGGTWSALGGGASWVTAASDSSVYVVSDSGGADRSIWHYASGNWSQIAGSGVSLSASLDTPGGIYITNSTGAIYYEDQTGGFVRLPGNAASIASIPGGVFALGYPASANGTALYYYDLDTPGWTVEPGSGVSVSATASAFYVVAANGGIYTSPIVAAGGGIGAAAACSRSPSVTAPSGYADMGASFFTTTLPAAKQICVSAWALSTDLDNALVAAAHNGANVAVLTPWSQHGSNDSDYATLNSAGVYTIWEYTSTAPATTAPYQSAIHSPMDIHAKFALVDGVGYLDGHNWFTTDVVMRTGLSADYLAMQNDLLDFPTPAAGNGPFTTDKQISLLAESAWMNGQTWGNGTEYDFITESFNPGSDGESNDDVYAAMCSIAKTGATMHFVFESESGYSATARNAILDLMNVDPNAVVHSNNNGHEKISMKRGGPSVWFGSSNMTTTDLFDWGYTLSDAGTISALQGYFDGQFASATNVSKAASTGASCSPEGEEATHLPRL